MRNIDYEKLYKEALEQMRRAVSERRCSSDFAESVFPGIEKRYSESIRQEILRHFKEKRSVLPTRCVLDEWIGWLEEQEPWGNNYDEAFDTFMDGIPEKDPDSSNSLYTYEDMLSAIKFGMEWSRENDMPSITDSEFEALEAASGFGGECNFRDLHSLYNKLKEWRDLK